MSYLARTSASQLHQFISAGTRRWRERIYVEFFDKVTNPHGVGIALRNNSGGHINTQFHNLKKKFPGVFVSDKNLPEEFQAVTWNKRKRKWVPRQIKSDADAYRSSLDPFIDYLGCGSVDRETRVVLNLLRIVLFRPQERARLVREYKDCLQSGQDIRFMEHLRQHTVNYWLVSFMKYHSVISTPDEGWWQILRGYFGKEASPELKETYSTCHSILRKFNPKSAYRWWQDVEQAVQLRTVELGLRENLQIPPEYAILFEQVDPWLTLTPCLLRGAEYCMLEYMIREAHQKNRSALEIIRMRKRRGDKQVVAKFFELDSAPLSQADEQQIVNRRIRRPMIIQERLLGALAHNMHGVKSQ